MENTRTKENRVKAWTGTVHAADSGYPLCGAHNTTYSRFTVADVTCKRCIAICGADERTGYVETGPMYVDEHQERRAIERAARRAARG